jgi:hypothetical protein
LKYSEIEGHRDSGHHTAIDSCAGRLCCAQFGNI